MDTQTDNLNPCPEGNKNTRHNIRFEWLDADSNPEKAKRLLDVAVHIERTRHFATNKNHRSVLLCDCETAWLKKLPGTVYNLHRRHTFS